MKLYHGIIEGSRIIKKNTFQLTTNNASRNDLYRTILESIIWYRNGDNIKVKINFK